MLAGGAGPRYDPVPGGSEMIAAQGLQLTLGPPRIMTTTARVRASQRQLRGTLA